MQQRIEMTMMDSGPHQGITTAIWGLVSLYIKATAKVIVTPLSAPSTPMAAASYAIIWNTVFELTPTANKIPISLRRWRIKLINSPYAQSIAQEVLRDRSSDKLDCRALR